MSKHNMTTAKSKSAATTRAATANNRGNAKFSGRLSGGASLAALAAGLVLGGGLLTSQMAMAQTTGIITSGNGPGALIVTSPADIVEDNNDGIRALNGGSGTDLTITSTAVTGSLDGIEANNIGTGALSITSTGAVSGTTGRGILAENGRAAFSYYDPYYGVTYYTPAVGTSLTIAAAAVAGGTDGIFAKNLGTGALSITATDTVTGANRNGIDASNSSAGTNLTIATAAVVGFNSLSSASQNPAY